MADRATRLQLRLVAAMVVLMWWAFFEWRRPQTDLPPRPERRQVFPPTQQRDGGRRSPFIHRAAITTPMPDVSPGG